MSMAHSVEVRLPMIDQEVVELVARLPSRTKIVRGRRKPLLVDSVHDLLPSQVVDRPKAGFVLPFERWLRTALATPVRESLLDERHGGAVAGVLDPVATAAVWSDFERGRTSWHRPWALYVLKEWSERHLPA
jgi:asparagine synthase (glutamine-hydrolysing)